MNPLHGLLQPWTPDELESIHQASLRILERTGVWIGHDAVLGHLERAGANVDRAAQVVRFPPTLVQDVMRHAPGSWDRGPRRPFSVSADCGAQQIWDHGLRHARPVRPRDLIDAPRLVQALPSIDAAGTLVHSPDVPPPVADLIAYRHMWHHTQKKGGGGLGRNPSCCDALLPASFDYLCELLAIRQGAAAGSRAPEFSFFMGVASPLRYSHDILAMALHTIRRGQVVGIGGNCNCGVQSPITPAANIALDHAERLAGLCIVTAVDPAARFYFCNHTYFLDLQSADIASGSPEQTLLALLGQQVLAHCGFHLAVNHPIMDVGAHVPDAQAAAEKMMYALLTALGGAGGIGGAGQLKEDFCYEQLVVDDEIAGYVKHLLKGAAVTPETIALPAIEALGIGASFLESDATLDHWRAVYHPPQLFGRKRKSEWQRAGARDALDRAHEKVVTTLAADTPTFLNAAQLAAMDALIVRACRELAGGWDPAPFLHPA